MGKREIAKEKWKTVKCTGGFVSAKKREKLFLFEPVLPEGSAEGAPGEVCSAKNIFRGFAYVRNPPPQFFPISPNFRNSGRDLQLSLGIAEFGGILGYGGDKIPSI